MRWWRRPEVDEGDVETDEVVERRLRRVVGPAEGVYGLSADPAIHGAGEAGSADAPAPPELPDPVNPIDAVDPVDPAAARRALAAFDPGRRGIRALAVVAAVVVAVVAIVAWRSRPEAEPVAPVPAVASAAAAVTPSPAGIVVAVAGRVQRPGLVRLPPGARVADAIEAAGGALPGTELAFVNLARKLIDGELLVIGASPPPGTPGTGPAPAQPGAPGGGPVNLNTATAAELDSLPGVGPVLAQRIVDYRTRHGGFRSVDELRKVDGVGDARFAQLKELVTV